MELSRRLKAVIGLVSPGNRAADVGCDHGFVSIALIQQKICPSVIASDLRPGPLSRAAEHVQGAGLGDRITLRLGDGLQVLARGEADTIILAGIGGRLLIRVLSESEKTAKSARELILSPQSDLRAVRRFLRESGYTLQRERFLTEDDKPYFVFRVLPEPDPATWTEAEYGFGKRIDPGDRAPWLAFLDREETLRENILKGLQAGPAAQEARAREIRSELDQIRERKRQERMRGSRP